MSIAASELKLKFDRLGESIDELKRLCDDARKEAAAEIDAAVEATAAPECAERPEVTAETRNAPQSHRGATADAYVDRVGELQSAWESFAAIMKDKVDFEELLQRASLSRREQMENCREELRQKAVDAINEEIDRLRRVINDLLQIHNYRL